MCFNLVTSNQRIKVAKTDIICWKVLDEGNQAHYQNYHYVKRVVNPTVKLEKETNDAVYEGYHSYQTKGKAYGVVAYEKGETFVKKFIIPAGTKYYQNDLRHEYVSETIILAQR